MLRITAINLPAKDLVFISENNIADRIDSGVSKVGRAKPKNKVMPDFLAKFKLLVKLSSRLSFLILGARLTFAKLR